MSIEAVAAGIAAVERGEIEQGLSLLRAASEQLRSDEERFKLLSEDVAGLRRLVESSHYSVAQEIIQMLDFLVDMDPHMAYICLIEWREEIRKRVGRRATDCIQ